MTIEEQNMDFEIADAALIKLAKLAIMEVPGVAGISSSLSVRFGPAKVRGIAVKYADDILAADIHIVAYFGENLQELALQVQQSVGKALQTMVEPASSRIDVTIDDVVLRPQAAKDK
jgi:uncharacterized alkaline shock family protein YloU